MAALVQTAADKLGFNSAGVEDDDGYWYIKVASWRIYTGAGNPNGTVTAPLGSLSVDNVNGAFYRNTDGGTTWTAV